MNAIKKLLLQDPADDPGISPRFISSKNDPNISNKNSVQLIKNIWGEIGELPNFERKIY